MPNDLETTARDHLAPLLEADVVPADIDPSVDMAHGYGLTSLNKIVFLMSLCDDTGVDLSAFTELDVADMRTLGDVVAEFSHHVHSAPQLSWAELAMAHL